MYIQTSQEMQSYGQQLAKTLDSPTVIELIGDVGVGKTTLVQGLAKGLGIQDQITSPSFTISKRYQIPNSNKLTNLVHYDFYRLQDIGIMADELNEVISANQNIVVIEWGDEALKNYTGNKIQITIDLENDGQRKLKVC